MISTLISKAASATASATASPMLSKALLASMGVLAVVSVSFHSAPSATSPTTESSRRRQGDPRRGVSVGFELVEPTYLASYRDPLKTNLETEVAKGITRSLNEHVAFLRFTDNPVSDGTPNRLTIRLVRRGGVVANRSIGPVDFELELTGPDIVIGSSPARHVVPFRELDRCLDPVLPLASFVEEIIATFEAPVAKSSDDLVKSCLSRVRIARGGRHKTSDVRIAFPFGCHDLHVHETRSRFRIHTRLVDHDVEYNLDLQACGAVRTELHFPKEFRGRLQAQLIGDVTPATRRNLRSSRNVKIGDIFVLTYHKAETCWKPVDPEDFDPDEAP